MISAMSPHDLASSVGLIAMLIVSYRRRRQSKRRRILVIAMQFMQTLCMTSLYNGSQVCVGRGGGEFGVSGVSV